MPDPRFELGFCDLDIHACIQLDIRFLVKIRCVLRPANWLGDSCVKDRMHVSLQNKQSETVKIRKLY